jgi:hypothetical protein
LFSYIKIKIPRSRNCELESLMRPEQQMFFSKGILSLQKTLISNCNKKLFYLDNYYYIMEPTFLSLITTSECLQKF